MRDLISKVDKIASKLEEKGLAEEAKKLDVVSNTLEKSMANKEKAIKEILKVALGNKSFRQTLVARTATGLANAIGNEAQEEISDIIGDLKLSESKFIDEIGYYLEMPLDRFLDKL
jgi:transcriptional regulator NrdR family protein